MATTGRLVSARPGRPVSGRDLMFAAGSFVLVFTDTLVLLF